MDRQTPRVMEVLYSFVNGGSERIGSLLASELAQSGWAIEVCATHSAHGPTAEWLQKAGVPTHGLDVDSASRIGRRWRIYRLLRQRRIDILHVQHFSILALCYWPARLAGVRRIVVTEHAEKLLYRTPKAQRLAARYAKRADLVTVIHGGLRSRLVERMGVAPEHVRLIPNGIDQHRFQPAAHDAEYRRALGCTDDELLLGCVARLHEAKDHASLLRALSALPRSVRHAVRLALIGDGPERDNLERLARDLAMEDRVHFLGDRDDVEHLLPQLDLFVLPSKTEGVPLVLLEAMACGVPCVATAVGGIPELLDGDAGELVPAQRPDELTAALQRLLADADRRQELGHRGYTRVHSRYTLSEMVSSYADALSIPAAIAASTSRA